MQYAIIAAGEGSRLLQEGVTTPKPFVRVCGECLIDRLIRIFRAAGAERVNVVCRPESECLMLERLQAGVPLTYIVRTPPSSMHSLYELVPLLSDGDSFVLTTVDTVFKDREFLDFVKAFEHMLARKECDGLMGVTDYIDDEKPLYVKTDEQLYIQSFADCDATPLYVSGGVYGLTPKSLLTLQGCIDRGERRMRNFQRALLSDGHKLKAWPFSKVIDVDHAADIVKAEALLKE